jgi:hypothetical protein
MQSPFFLDKIGLILIHFVQNGAIQRSLDKFQTHPFQGSFQKSQGNYQARQAMSREKNLKRAFF